jgi:hypothetical protein
MENKIQNEVQEIRKQIYDEQKKLSPAEWQRRANERHDLYVQKYGFKVAK